MKPLLLCSTRHPSLELETKVREDLKITEKAPTRTFSWLKAAITVFTFKDLIFANQPVGNVHHLSLMKHSTSPWSVFSSGVSVLILTASPWPPCSSPAVSPAPMTSSALSPGLRISTPSCRASASSCACCRRNATCSTHTHSASIRSNSSNRWIWKLMLKCSM